MNSEQGTIDKMKLFECKKYSQTFLRLENHLGNYSEASNIR